MFVEQYNKNYLQMNMSTYLTRSLNHSLNLNTRKTSIILDAMLTDYEISKDLLYPEFISPFLQMKKIGLLMHREYVQMVK